MVYLVTAKYLCRQKFRATFVALSIASISVVGCGTDGEIDSLARTLHRGLSGEAETLDPHTSNSNQSASVLRDLGEGLVAYSPEGHLVGGVADRWTVSDDGLEYTFHIRDSARWSDGSPITADDFVYSLRRLVDPSTAAPYALFVAPLRNARAIVNGDRPPESLGVAAANSRYLKIRLESPAPHFLQLLTHPSTFPVHKASIERHQSQFMRPGNSVTNGAYLLEERVLGSTVVLRRNPHYWDNANTFFEKVVWVAVADDEETNMFRAGELDTTNSVAASLFRNVSKERAHELKVGPSLGVYFYGFNLKEEPFGDNHMLRRALSLAIDREAIVSKITGRGETPAYNWIPPGIEGYSSASFVYTSWSAEERAEEARRLYREAGYGAENVLRFELRYNTSDLQQQIALAIQDMWREVLGAEVSLISEEYRVLISNIQQGDSTQLFRLSWTGDYSDPLAFLELMTSVSPSNFMAYSNSEVDSLLLSAATEIDSSERMVLLRKAERIILEDHPVIPIYFHVNKYLVGSDIQGWHQNVLGIHYSKDLKRRVAD